MSKVQVVGTITTYMRGGGVDILDVVVFSKLDGYTAGEGSRQHRPAAWKVITTIGCMDYVNS